MSRPRGSSFGLSHVRARCCKRLSKMSLVSHTFPGQLRLRTYAPATVEGALSQYRLRADNKRGLSDVTGMVQPKTVKCANTTSTGVETRMLILEFVSLFWLWKLLGGQRRRQGGCRTFQDDKLRFLVLHLGICASFTAVAVDHRRCLQLSAYFRCIVG